MTIYTHYYILSVLYYYTFSELYYYTHYYILSVLYYYTFSELCILLCLLLINTLCVIYLLLYTLCVIYLLLYTLCVIYLLLYTLCVIYLLLYALYKLYILTTVLSKFYYFTNYCILSELYITMLTTVSWPQGSCMEHQNWREKNSDNSFFFENAPIRWEKSARKMM